MPDDPHPLEPALRSQRAADLDPQLLDRLEAAADGSLLELTKLEALFETELRRIQPTRLSPTLAASLERAAGTTRFPASPTVIPFQTSATVTRKPSNRSWWSAAAAVAILGATCALILPNRSQQTAGIAPPAGNASESTADVSPADTSPATPAAFSRELHQTSDEGLIWPTKDQPHRVIKVVYKDLVTLKREDGSTYQVEKPRVEYYIVPAEAD